MESLEKRQDYGNNKSLVAARGRAPEKDERAEPGGFSGQWKYSV